MTQFEDVLETILEEYARRDSEGEFDTWEETDAFVKKKAEVLLAYVKEEPVSEELEKVSDKYSEDIESNYSNDMFDRGDIMKAFEAGANWQKTKEEPVSEQLEKVAELYTLDDSIKPWKNLTKEAFKAGAKWQNEQMMANAVEGVVHHFEKCKVASVHYNDPTGVPMSYFMSSKGFLAGDKVKVIVIKED